VAEQMNNLPKVVFSSTNVGAIGLRQRLWDEFEPWSNPATLTYCSLPSAGIIDPATARVALRAIAPWMPTKIVIAGTSRRDSRVFIGFFGIGWAVFQPVVALRGVGQF
jgi:hypothetical protein